jgi:hypothetical protein
MSKKASVNLNKLAATIALSDHRDGKNLDVVDVKIVFRLLAKELEFTPPAEVLAILSAIIKER